MYGSEKNIRHNLKVFFVDGISFMPSMALISITAVIPFFLDQLGATTFQIGLATAMTLICALLTQPFFGFLASRSKIMHRTFAKILLLQRVIFIAFILSIPLFSGNNPALIIIFLAAWCVFNLFVGSYTVFHTPLVIRLLPPNKRGTIRGIGFAIGSFLGVGMAALIPLILGRIAFPYNYMVIFLLGSFFLIVNAIVFFFLRQSDEQKPVEPLSLPQYLKNMPVTIKESPAFRAMILTSLFLVVANSMLPFYMLYAIREFSVTEMHLAILAGLQIFTAAIAHITFGQIVDRFGPRIVGLIVAILILSGGILALTTNTLYLFFVVWVLANIGNNGSMTAISLLLGEVSPSEKLPLYVGVHFTISMAVSAVIVLVLSPVLENLGFVPLFMIVVMCSFCSLMINTMVLRGRLAKLKQQQ